MLTAIVVGSMFAVAASAVTADEHWKHLRGTMTTVYADDGTPLFDADEHFLVVAGANPDRRVVSVDRSRGMVRVSALARDGYWLRCNAFEPVLRQCGGVVEKRRRGGSGRGFALPQCPGDLRCPKLK